MVYRNNFIAVVKCNNKILREKYDKDHDENVLTIPFGSEYAIEFKNQDSRRAFVSVEIDGVNATKCGNIVVPPNEKVELERFLDNLTTGNRFKFVKKIKEIVDHRGDKIDDGIIRIEYWFEKEKRKHTDLDELKKLISDRPKEYVPCPYPYPQPIIIREKEYVPYYPTPIWYYNPSNLNSGYVTYNNTDCSPDSLGISDVKLTTNSFMLNSNITRGVSDNSSPKDGFINNTQVNSTCYQCNIDDSEGVTVKGSVSNQEFNMIHNVEMEEQSRVICIKMRGYNEEKQEEVKIPITVDTKIQCDRCGKYHKSIKIYCDVCGNYLS